MRFLIINHRKVVLKWKKKKVSDESIVEEAKGETPEETTTEDGTEAKETKETKTKKKKKSAAALEIELKRVKKRQQR